MPVIPIIGATASYALYAGVTSAAVSAIGTGINYYGQQQQASNAEAIASYNAAAQRQNADVQARLAQQQATWNEQAKMAQYQSQQNNATTLEGQKLAAEAQGRAQAESLRQQQERLLATQRAHIAKSGVAVYEGSPLEDLADTAKNTELGIQDAAYQTELDSRQWQQKADDERFQSGFSLMDASLDKYQATSIDMGRQMAYRQADLPRNKQGYLNALLSQQYEKTAKAAQTGKDPAAHDQQLAYWLSESNRLGQSGFFGDTGRLRKNFNVITDPRQSAAYGEKLLNIRIQLQDWSKQNPKATPQQWRDQFYQTVQPYTDEHLTSLLSPPAWQDRAASSGDTPQPTPVPVTHYSLGRDVGGPDPMQDSNTNRGYSARGPNLTPGAAAVNTDKYPLGTIFQDHDTGEVFLATDRHKNDDPNVVDLYQSPDRYQDNKTSRNLSVIGRAAHIPRDADGLRKLLATVGDVPEGESAAETLTRLRGGNLARR